MRCKSYTYLTLSWRRSLLYRNHPIDLLWTGFYMIRTSVIKELRPYQTSVQNQLTAFSCKVFSLKGSITDAS